MSIKLHTRLACGRQDVKSGYILRTQTQARSNVCMLACQQATMEVAVYYRAYTIGPDGHFVDFLNIEAEDDRAAIETARNCLQGRDVEVWQQAREVGRLDQHAET